MMVLEQVQGSDQFRTAKQNLVVYPRVNDATPPAIIFDELALPSIMNEYAGEVSYVESFLESKQFFCNTNVHVAIVSACLCIMDFRLSEEQRLARVQEALTEFFLIFVRSNSDLEIGNIYDGLTASCAYHVMRELVLADHCHERHQGPNYALPVSTYVIADIIEGEPSDVFQKGVAWNFDIATLSSNPAHIRALKQIVWHGHPDDEGMIRDYEDMPRNSVIVSEAFLLGVCMNITDDVAYKIIEDSFKYRKLCIVDKQARSLLRRHVIAISPAIIFPDLDDNGFVPEFAEPLEDIGFTPILGGKEA